jgi:malate dehydrogenase
LLACAAYLDGEYGYKDLFMGVPAIVGGNGVERIVEIPLSEEERAMLARSAKSVQAVVDLCKAGTSPASPQHGHEKG